METAWFPCWMERLHIMDYRFENGSTKPFPFGGSQYALATAFAQPDPICDYFMWGFLESKVCKSKSTTIEDLNSRILETFQKIKLEMFRKVIENYRHRLTALTQNGGCHIQVEEKSLKYLQSNSRKLMSVKTL